MHGTNTNDGNLPSRERYSGKRNQLRSTSVDQGSLDEYEDTYATGSISSSQHGIDRNDPNYSSHAISIDDFTIVKVIGRGSFGKVYLV